jgi:conjugal transfer/entry exclusion protein
MSNWYSRVLANLGEIPNFIAHYEREMEQARYDISVKGNIEKNLAALPGQTEHRFNQLQEIEAVLNYLNIQLRQIRRKHFQKYLEHYARALTSRDAEKYVDGEQEVVDFETLINEVALLRNKWLGVIKAIESKSWMMGHITRLRAAGMEDIML